MNVLFEMLFNARCPAYDPDKVPAYLRNDPVQAYGQLSFQRGFQLALCLAVSCLITGEMEELQ